MIIFHKIVNNLKKNWIIFLIALLIGLSASMRWIYPLYLEIKSSGDYKFIPIIRNSVTGRQDDQYYYSLIREVIDGKLPLDPSTYENKNKISMHSSYLFSIIMCSLGGVFTKRTEHAYYFNHFIYPIINFLLIQILFFLFIKNKILSIFLSLLTMTILGVHNIPFNLFEYINVIYQKICNMLLFKPLIYYDYDVFESVILRTPLFFTNFHIFILIICMFLLIERNNKSVILKISTIFLLSISTITSMQNFIISYTIFGFLTLLNINNKEIFKRLFFVFIISIILSLPGLYILFKSILFLLNTSFYYANTIENINDLYKALIFLFPGYIFLIFFKFRHKKFILGICTSLIITFFILLLKLRIFFSVTRYLFRGCFLLYTILIMSGLILVILNIIRDKEINLRVFNYNLLRLRLNINSINNKENFIIQYKKHIFKIIKILLLVFSFFYSFLLVCQGLYFGKTYFSPKIFNHPKLYQLINWGRDNIKNNEVVLTLDFNLIENMIVYTPANMYIPVPLLSPTSQKEKIKRFFEISNIYGITPDEMEKIINNTPRYTYGFLEDIESTIVNQLCLLTDVLFYTRHLFYPEKEKKDKEELIKKYFEFYNYKKNTLLSYKYDYLIISKIDNVWINNNSIIKKIITNEKPLFNNEYYKVYKIRDLLN